MEPESCTDDAEGACDIHEVQPEAEPNKPVVESLNTVQVPEKSKKAEVRMIPRDWVDLSVFADPKYDISEEIELSSVVAEYYAQINL